MSNSNMKDLNEEKREKLIFKFEVSQPPEYLQEINAKINLIGKQNSGGQSCVFGVSGVILFQPRQK